MRFILVDITLPVRIRPRIETSPVNGHFLSVKMHEPRQTSMVALPTDVSAADSVRGRFEAKPHIFVPPLLLCDDLLPGCELFQALSEESQPVMHRVTHPSPWRFGTGAASGTTFRSADGMFNRG